MPRKACQGVSPAKRLAIINRIKKRDGAACKLCFKPFKNYTDITIDHYIARAWGGPDNINNWVLAHDNCNTGKEDKGLAWVWMLLISILDRIHRPPNKLGKLRRFEQDKATLIKFAQVETEWFGVTWHYFKNAFWGKHGTLSRTNGKHLIEKMIADLNLDEQRLNHWVNINQAVLEKSRANNDDFKSILNNPGTWPRITNPELLTKLKNHVGDLTLAN